MNKPTGKEFAKQLSSFMNGVRASDLNEFLKELKNDHRTLQQDTIRLFLQAIENMSATPDNRTDHRNVGSRDVCIDVVEGWRYQRYLALINEGYEPEKAKEIVKKWIPSGHIGHI